MNISPISSKINSLANINKNNNKKQQSMAFASVNITDLKNFQIGVFSDWFYKMVKDRSHLSEKIFNDKMMQDLKAFKEERKRAYGGKLFSWIFSKDIDIDIDSRKFDYINLRECFENPKEFIIEKTGKDEKIDNEIGKYSTLLEYDLRHPHNGFDTLDVMGGPDI